MNKNTTIAILIIAIIGLTYLAFKPNNISDSELFELKKECSTLAEEFAQEHTSSEFNTEIIWQVLHSDYNVQQQSCFGEFDKTVNIAGSESFSEYLIYDLLTKEEVKILTYFESDLDDEWARYYAEHSPEYYRLRKEVFGLEKDER